MGQRSHLVRHYAQKHPNQPIPPHAQCNDPISENLPQNNASAMAEPTGVQVEPARTETQGSVLPVVHGGHRAPARMGSDENERERQNIVLKLRLKNDEKEN